jgi:alkylated DNA nucleotide flippase Atl1
MKSERSWREKLSDGKGLPKVEKIPDAMSKQWGEGTMAIPSPQEVNDIMKEVPRGKVITIHEIRSCIARKHGATIGCPITTGIFVWIAAHAAEEEAQEGKKRVTPYWRTLKTGGILNDKYPGGAEAQLRKLESEGHIIVQKGKNYVVENFEVILVEIN